MKKSLPNIMLVLIIVFVFALSLTGCSSNKEESTEIEPTLREAMSLDEYLKWELNSTLGEITNNDMVRLIELKTLDNTKIIKLNVDDHLSNDMIIRGIHIGVEDYLYAIHDDTEVLALDEIRLIFEMEFKNNYGETKNMAAVVFAITTESMQKIDWGNFMTDDIPKIADYYFLHEAFN